VSPSYPAEFPLFLRLPGWCREATLLVNGEPLNLAGHVSKGYAGITRTWAAGDVVELDLAMPVERIYAHPRVSADAGCVAFQRGPLVYCLEEVDNPVALHRLSVDPEAHVATHVDADRLGGVVTLHGDGRVADETGWDGTLYRHAAPTQAPFPLTAIPYHMWDNRQSGQMRVWIREAGSHHDG
jgi:DUF1680 family protein